MTVKVYIGPVSSTSKFLLHFPVFSLHIVRQERQTQFNAKFVLAEGYLKELNNLLTYVLTPCNKVLLEKLISSRLAKIFPAFYGTERFFTAFTYLYPEPATSSPCPHIPLPVDLS